MKDLIEKIAKALVDQPEHVRVTETKTDALTLIELNVAKEDVGKIIGKQGRTADAMRALLSAACGKSGKRATLEITNP